MQGAQKVAAQGYDLAAVITRHRDDVINRTNAMLQLDAASGMRPRMNQIRAFMDGGAEAAKLLLGPDYDPDDPDVPAANYVQAHVNRLAQKVGRMPSLRVPPPVKDNRASAREAADKRERIVLNYDRHCRLDQMLPQAARWLAGYGYVVFAVKDGQADGYHYPKLSMYDPYQTILGNLGPDQQPNEFVVRYLCQIDDLCRFYPEQAGALRLAARSRSSGSSGAMYGGSVSGGTGSWGNQSGTGVEVTEYWDQSGCWMLVPEYGIVLDLIRNPLERPQFVTMKRFAFNELHGHYDSSIGLQKAITRANYMAGIAMEDAVFSPLNVYGESQEGPYERGRFAMNYFPAGTTVSRDRDNLPYQMFEHVNKLERQLRIDTNYPVSDDGQSPNSFATGAGVQELQGASANDVREYQLVIKDGLERLDHIRLAFDEARNPHVEKPMEGEQRGAPFAETYTPAVDIAGNYRTVRKFGAMAALDDTVRAAALQNLAQQGLLDSATVLENMDGIDNPTEVLRRVEQEQIGRALREVLTTRAVSGDPAALEALIAKLPDGPEKREFRKILAAPETPAPAVPPPPQMTPASLFDALNGRTPMPPDAAMMPPSAAVPV